MIDIGLDNHDKEFYNNCRSRLLSIKPEYHKSISKKKLYSIKFGYYSTSAFLFLHQLKQRLRS